MQHEQPEATQSIFFIFDLINREPPLSGTYNKDTARPLAHEECADTVLYRCAAYKHCPATFDR